MTLGSDSEVPAARHGATLLLRQILTLSDALEKRLSVELGVNSTDLDAMQHLIESGPLSPSELAQRLGISTAAVTVSIDRLVRAGHVSRQRHPTDRRRLRILPSQDSVGRVMSSLMPMIAETNAIMDRYTEDERAVITDYLTRAVGVLQDWLRRNDAAE